MAFAFSSAPHRWSSTKRWGTTTDTRGPHHVLHNSRDGSGSDGISDKNTGMLLSSEKYTALEPDGWSDQRD